MAVQTHVLQAPVNPANLWALEWAEGSILEGFFAMMVLLEYILIQGLPITVQTLTLCSNLPDS